MLADNFFNTVFAGITDDSVLKATSNRVWLSTEHIALCSRQMGITYRAINSEVNNQSTVKLPFWYHEVCLTYFAPKYLIRIIIINIVRRPKIVHFLFYYYLIDNSI